MKIIKFFAWMDRVAVAIAMISLFIMMLAVTADTLARSLFNSPITGVFELVQNYLMVAMVFLGLSYTLKVKGHVRIDLLINKLPRKVSILLEAFVLLLALIIFAAIGYLGLQTTLEAYINNYKHTGIIAWPVWLSTVWVPLGSLFLVIRMVIQIITLVIQTKETMLAEDTSLSKDILLTDEQDQKTNPIEVG